MSYIGKIKRTAKELAGGKKTYLPKDKKVKEVTDTARYHTRKAKARVEAAAKKEGVELKGLTKRAKARRASKAKPKKKGITTARTKTVRSGLKKAGLTKQEVARFGNKSGSY